ncbi:hypothetical protein CAPTEDRAFT_136603, partial [Capitella teleta]
TPEMIKRFAAREPGPGCDQLIVLEQSPAGADLFMRIYNADGSEVGACGNAARCVAWLIMQENAQQTCRIETLSGIIGGSATSNEWITSIDMGRPKFDWQDIPLAEEFHDTRGIELQVGPIDAPILHTPSVVNVGNPHAIYWVKSFSNYDLSGLGPLLEHHPLFPERANISLAIVHSDTHIELKVWERGVGLTKACGSAACAAAVCASRNKLTEREVKVTLPGGDLWITWREDDHIIMTGAVALDGIIELATS